MVEHILLRFARRTGTKPPARRTRRAAMWSVLAVGSMVALTGCQHSFRNGFLPTAVTQGGRTVTNLWVGAWIAVLAVGFLVWGLILWSVAAYRRKKDDEELPVQFRYNVPIEILYTVVPVLMVVVFFYYTARDESSLMDASKPADVTVNVIAKQWSWDFNYINANVHEAGTQAILTGQPGAEKTIPTLYLPVNKRVKFLLTSRDVIHSFWVPAFLQKLDVIPGRVNQLEIVPTQTGTFAGKCAELCGAYHSQMLFNVKVVTQAQYDQHMRDLAAEGQTGLLPNGLSRIQVMPSQENLLPSPARS